MRTDVFLLPCAGGAASSYRPVVKAAPASLNCIPIELPGRGSRLYEALPRGLDDMVGDAVAQIGAHENDRPNEPFSIFGHSMGALLAWLTTRAAARIESIRRLSGRRARR